MKHAEVLEIIDRSLSCVVGKEATELDRAARRICAEDVLSPRNVPLADNTAVDGYAFAHDNYVASDGHFTLGALIAAGDSHTITLKPGECARVFTGAIMPQNADTVAMQEDCEIGTDGSIHVPSGLKAGANCRLAGEDLKAGEKLVAQGDILTPARLGALASIGIGKIKTHEKLRIAILSTGNELLEAGGNITTGMVFDANRPMLKSLLSSSQVEITDLGIIPDDEAEITSVMASVATKHDLVLTSGGASRGDEDHMLNVLSNLGKRHLWQIAIKPGRPLMFGQIADCVVIGLPGNPVAAMVCANLYVFRVVARLTGAQNINPIPIQVPCDFEIKHKKPDRREFLRGWLARDSSGKTVAKKFDRDGSGLISGLRMATGLIEIPEHVTTVQAGQIIDFIPFSGFKTGQ